MKSVLKEALLALGFTKISPTCFGCVGGQLIHVVKLVKDRHGQESVCLTIWHPSFVEDAPEQIQLIPNKIQSPVFGDLSPRGVVRSWIWASGLPGHDALSKRIVEFFSVFRELEDLLAVTKGRLSPFYAERLGAWGGHYKLVPELCDARYPVVGGALEAESAKRLLTGFTSSLKALGKFELVDAENMIWAKPRGDFYDCVLAQPDEFSTFVRFFCFPWTQRVWEIEPRWNKKFHPLAPVGHQEMGDATLLPISSLPTLDSSQIELSLQQLISQSEAVNTESDFIASLAPSWKHFAERF